jgi:hypothetical protein
LPADTFMAPLHFLCVSRGDLSALRPGLREAREVGFG